jgi:hypothetical protein
MQPDNIAHSMTSLEVSRSAVGAAGMLSGLILLSAWEKPSMLGLIGNRQQQIYRSDNMGIS